MAICLSAGNWKPTCKAKVCISKWGWTPNVCSPMMADTNFHCLGVFSQTYSAFMTSTAFIFWFHFSITKAFFPNSSFFFGIDTESSLSFKKHQVWVGLYVGKTSHHLCTGTITQYWSFPSQKHREMSRRERWLFVQSRVLKKYRISQSNILQFNM